MNDRQSRDRRGGGCATVPAMPTIATVVTPPRSHDACGVVGAAQRRLGPQRRAVEVQREHWRGILGLGLREVRGQIRSISRTAALRHPAQSIACSSVPRNAARSTVTRERSPKGVSQRTQVSTLAASSAAALHDRVEVRGHGNTSRASTPFRRVHPVTGGSEDQRSARRRYAPLRSALLRSGVAEVRAAGGPRR